jgi:hypothetical protein
MEDVDIRELAGTEGTCGLSDLDTLTLGRDDAVDGGLCLASGWKSVGCGIDCLSAVDRAGEEWLTFRHGVSWLYTNGYRWERVNEVKWMWKRRRESDVDKRSSKGKGERGEKKGKMNDDDSVAPFKYVIASIPPFDIHFPSSS